MLSSVTEQQRLQQMIDDLRRMRERCEPKSNQNPRYLRYSGRPRQGSKLNLASAVASTSDNGGDMQSPTWDALAAEAGISSTQLALGATSLANTSPYEPWTYARAFFALSIGIERAAKLVLQIDAYLQTRKFLTVREMRNRGHDLVTLCSAAEEVCQRRYPDQPDLHKPSDELHERILQVLSDFATGDRYHHLDKLAGDPAVNDSPEGRWWREVVEYVARIHPAKRSAQNAVIGSLLDETLRDKAIIRQKHVDGRDITSLRELYAGQMDELIPWVCMYTLQIARWLGRTLSDLGRGRDDQIPYLNDFFRWVDQDDRDLRRRRRWRIT